MSNFCLFSWGEVKEFRGSPPPSLIQPLCNLSVPLTVKQPQSMMLWGTTILLSWYSALRLKGLTFTPPVIVAKQLSLCLTIKTFGLSIRGTANFTRAWKHWLWSIPFFPGLHPLMIKQSSVQWIKINKFKKENLQFSLSDLHWVSWTFLLFWVLVSLMSTVN